MHEENKAQGGEHHSSHHILSDSTSMRVFIYLLIFTVITVLASRLDFGALNFPIAMLIACAKAMAVVLFFMGLKYDSNENRIIFGVAFAFVLIFLTLTGADLFSRGNVIVQGSPLMEVAGGPQFETPWISSEVLVAHGKKVYQNQACNTCHGDEGRGDGPAGGALNPRPRNFHEDEGWKNGRKPSEVFKTLTEGMGLMPSYSTLSIGDRWAVAHYVLSLGSTPPADTPEDLAKIGIDPSKEDGGLGGGPKQRTLPVDFALERYIHE